jgi:hypothetical protein
LDHLGLNTAVAEVALNGGLRMMADGPDALWVLADEAVADVEVWATSCQLLLTVHTVGRVPARVDLTGIASGSYLLAVRTRNGQRLVRSIVR